MVEPSRRHGTRRSHLRYTLRSCRPPLLGLLTFGILASGCQIGPSALKVSSSQYSDAVRIAQSEQLLVNIVRLHYRDAPIFLAVSSISTQFELSQTGDITGTLIENVGAGGGSTPDSLGLGYGVRYSERPTITFTILGGEDFQTRMLTPLPVEVISLVAESGWRGDRLFRLTVEEINGLENAPRASGPTPASAPIYEEFIEAIALLQTLSDNRLVKFEFETRQSMISSPVPIDSVSGVDLVTAAKTGVTFLATPDGERMSLMKEERVLFLRFSSRAAESPDAMRLKELLRLRADQFEYRVVNAEKSTYDPLRPDETVNDVAIDTRSLTGVLYYLSNAVQSPPKHKERGFVTTTVDANGAPFDWSDLLGEFFHVYSSPTRPDNAAVAVRHRNFWFYIRDDDISSKSTFMFVLQLFALLAGDVEKTKPVLTLPVGG